MKTLLATAALAIAGAVTVQAAEIFTCRGLGYATHNGKIERADTHWAKLGEHFSALVYYVEEPDGFHVVATTQQGATEKAAVFSVRNDLGGGAVDRGFHSARRVRGAGADRAQQHWRPPGYRGGSRHRFHPVTPHDEKKKRLR